MKKQFLPILWGGMYILCAALSFIPTRQGWASWLLTAAAMLFFLPPLVMVYDAAKAKDRKQLKLVRNLSAASLGLTLAALVGNFLAIRGGDALGTVLHVVLTLVSCPMICCASWALSLFLWACLLMVSLRELRKK